MILSFNKWWQWHRWLQKSENGKVMYNGIICWVYKSGLVPVELESDLNEELSN
tara:strand:+ start:137 stop:295 length:159 start_codon:yes stop_codon:yes gene_type:complete